MNSNKSTYSCVIIDDETLAQELIKQHVSLVSGLIIKGMFHDPLEAQNYLNENDVDLVFLDIEMPKMNGLEFIKSLNHQPKIVLTTAYAEFALDGFELNVVDYLLKPIVFERFQQATDKAFQLINLERSAPNKVPELKQDSIIIRASHELIKVKLNDILYIEGLHKYVRIRTTQQSHTVLFGMAALMKELPHRQFFRCHRSFIVNVEKVDKIAGNEAIISKYSIPISRGNKQELLELMGRQIGE